MAPTAHVHAYDLTFRFWSLCIRKYLKECMSSFSYTRRPWLVPLVPKPIHKVSQAKLLARILRRQQLIFDTCYTALYHSLCSWFCIIEP